MVRLNAGDAHEGCFGHYVLAENEHLLLSIYDQLAADHDRFDTLNQFQKRFQSRPIEPKAPDPNDRQLAPARKWTSETPAKKRKERLAWQAYHYHKAQQQYEKDLQTFATNVAEHRRIVSTYPHSLRGYVAYMGDALELDRSPDRQSFFLPNHVRYPLGSQIVDFTPI